MSTNVFIWIKHGTHRWFEQIRFPNFQNYPPIFGPRISDAPWRDSHAPKSFQLICNAQCFQLFFIMIVDVDAIVFQLKSTVIASIEYIY